MGGSTEAGAARAPGARGQVERAVPRAGTTSEGAAGPSKVSGVRQSVVRLGVGMVAPQRVGTARGWWRKGGRKGMGADGGLGGQGPQGRAMAKPGRLLSEGWGEGPGKPKAAPVARPLKDGRGSGEGQWVWEPLRDQGGASAKAPPAGWECGGT